MDPIRRADLLTQLTGLVELHAGRHCSSEQDLLDEVVGDGLWASLGSFRSLVRSPSPARRGVLFVPGLFSSHLRNPARCPQRQWLSALSLLRGHLAERLSLDANADPQGTFADAVLPIYGRAIAWWSLLGHDVHTFPFDWRLNMDGTAAAFARGLEQLAARDPNQEFVLVTHSMGGLVASLAYPQLTPAARKLIVDAVLVGPPLGGSFDVITAMSGEHLLVALLAAVTPLDNRDDYRRLARSLPGLLEMLPAPEVFAGGTASLYQQQTWPPAFAPLRQAWLDRARTLLGDVDRSPLLDRASILAAAGHWTLTSFTHSPQGHPVAGSYFEHGDGMVPLRSAARSGRDTFVIDGQHALLLDQPEVITAVGRRLRNEPLGLPRRPGGAKAIPQTTLEHRDKLWHWEKLHAHTRAKLMTPTNMRWLLDSRAQPVVQP